MDQSSTTAAAGRQGDAAESATVTRLRDELKKRRAMLQATGLYTAVEMLDGYIIETEERLATLEVILEDLSEEFREFLEQQVLEGVKL